MTTQSGFEIFLAAAPGTEAWLLAEAREKHFKNAKAVAGGVTIEGGWPDVWRANLELRGSSRVLARIETFRVLHLAQLDKRARRVAWGSVLSASRPFCVEASCSKSRIYHSGAAVERIQRAIAEELGAAFSGDADVCVKVRIENDICSISVDTSGEPLHKRGHKQAVNAAPLRENLAALFLRACGYGGRETVVDPMCGSGTFVIEAAEIAAGLNPGRSRAFAFEQLATFDATAWDAMRRASTAMKSSSRFYGSDRDAGAIRISRENGKRAGVSELTTFEEQSVSALKAPDGPPGLVIVNPPYGLHAKVAVLLPALGERLGEGPSANWRTITFGEP